MAKQLIVAGFHRSGTSLIMQYLYRCGLFVGYDLIGSNDSNPYGHFEDREIVRTHDWILEANQANWMVAEPFVPVLEPAHWTRLRDIIVKRDSEHLIWGFKDPRVCNFLAQWKHLIPDAKVLIVFRNPRECIHSLHRRHAYELFKKKGNPEVHRRFFNEPDLALRMWNAHNAALIAFARAHPHDVLVLHHGTFTDEFLLATKLNELWSFGLETIPVSEVYDETITRSAPMQTPVHDANIVDEALENWRTLSVMEAETTGIADLQTKDAVEKNDFLFDQGAALLHVEKELLEFEGDFLKSTNEELRSEAAGRDGEIKRLRAELQARSGEAARRSEEIKRLRVEKELLEFEGDFLKSTNEELRSEAAGRDGEIKRLRATLGATAHQTAKLQDRIHSIKRSVVWKVAKPVWKMERWLSRQDIDGATRRDENNHTAGSSVQGSRLLASKLRRASAPAAEPGPIGYIRDGATTLAAEVLPSEYRNTTLAIVIPVYNAASDLRACLESVVEHTTLPAGVLIIDDASTDPDISPLLEEFATIPSVTVVRNEHNLGYTRTVNKGIKLAGRADVILLNSDAIVTPRWLENLHLTAYSRSRIATVTPISDNAGAFSVPEYGEANARPAWVHRDAYARMITQVSGMLRPSVPTGNGFCMYIRRSCIDEVGALDEAAFPRGYGEENDFCMRALHSGWTNIVDDRTIVYHRRSASFGGEKHHLMKQGAAILNDRYPEYKILTKAFKDKHMDAVRDRVRSLNTHSAKQADIGKPRVLFVISVRTGGTPLTNGDLMEAVRGRLQPWLLRCDSREIELSYVGPEGVRPVANHKLAEPIGIATHVSDEYDQVVESWLAAYAIELVHIRHISWNSLNLTRICKSLHIPIVFSFHDFYCVCPTVKLLDETRKFCGGTCTETPGECTVELWRKDTIPQLKNRWVRNWRSMMRRMLLHCDAFVTTSSSTRDIILSAFPELSGRDFRVIPHGRSFSRMLQCGRPPEKDRPVKILVPGHISVAKGGEVIAEIVKRDRHGRFEFHILGKLDKKLQGLQGPRVVKHGPYQREEMAAKVAAIEPHFGAVFSIWAETYCHTLTELWACGLPVLTFGFGAVGERVRASGGGWLLPHGEPDALFAAMCEIASDHHEVSDRIAEVRAWQSGEGRWNNIDRMAASYINLYEQVFEGRRAFPAPGRQNSSAMVGQRIQSGIVVPGDLRSG